MDFKSLLNNRMVILDGATGTNLAKKGMSVEECTELWVLDHKDVMIELQKAYLDAGTDILYAPTFQANAIKLAERGLEDQVESLCQALVNVTKEAAAGKALIAGDMTMTGQQLAPMGDITFEELVDCYAQQAKALDQAGVDCFVVETMLSVQETRAAIIGIRKVSQLPIMVSLTFEANGKNLYGTDPLTALIILQDMGIDAFGINCSSGPEALKAHMEAMKPYAKIPLIAKANAGLPECKDGETIFPMGPEEFAQKTLALAKAGAGFVGGCCGTTPEHIKALVDLLKEDGQYEEPAYTQNIEQKVSYPVIATERKIYEFENGFSELVVGTVITASKQPELCDDFSEGYIDTLYDLLDEEADAESDIILVDLDSDAFDIYTVLDEVIMELKNAPVPVAFTTNDMTLLEKYLCVYPGKALIAVKSGSDLQMTKELIEKYGAVELA